MGTRFLARLGAPCLTVALALLPGRVDAHAVRTLAAAPQQASGESADQLFERRDPDTVQRAIVIWKARLATHPTDADAAWKLARALYWVGANSREPREARRPVIEEGVAVARRATAMAPSRPEGQFWLAANLGLLSELFGRREGLRNRDDIRKALEAVIATNPGYLDGAAQRALGRWYATVPPMFGGNRKRGEALLREALARNPNSPITLFLLAELLLDTGRRAEARASLAAAVAAPAEPEWAPEDERFRARARDLLATIDRQAP